MKKELSSGLSGPIQGTSDQMAPRARVMLKPNQPIPPQKVDVGECLLHMAHKLLQVLFRRVGGVRPAYSPRRSGHRHHPRGEEVVEGMEADGHERPERGGKRERQAQAGERQGGQARRKASQELRGPGHEQPRPPGVEDRPQAAEEEEVAEVAGPAGEPLRRRNRGELPHALELVPLVERPAQQVEERKEEEVRCPAHRQLHEEAAFEDRGEDDRGLGPPALEERHQEPAGERGEGQGGTRQPRPRRPPAGRWLDTLDDGCYSRVIRRTR